jgi:hypothetical protein
VGQGRAERLVSPARLGERSVSVSRDWASPDSIILGERFRVDHAIRLSNSGGIFAATDLETMSDVVIKDCITRHSGARQGSSRLLGRAASVSLAPEILADSAWSWSAHSFA